MRTYLAQDVQLFYNRKNFNAGPTSDQPPICFRWMHVRKGVREKVIEMLSHLKMGKQLKAKDRIWLIKENL